MARKCTKFPLKEFIDKNKEHFEHLDIIDVEIYIDNKELKEIELVFTSEKKKLISILRYMVQGKYKDDLYGKENIDDRCKNLTAMKFKGKLNTRIYCQEIHESGKKIIAIHLLVNKSFQKANQKVLKPKLQSIATYEYEFEE